jgi:transcriptional regulator with XRE-family HTH domain
VKLLSENGVAGQQEVGHHSLTLDRLLSRPFRRRRRAILELGQDIRDARRRRGLPTEVVAQRAFTSRPTLHRIETGDTGVSIGIYAAVLHALGLLEGMAQLADPRLDETGLSLDAATCDLELVLFRRELLWFAHRRRAKHRQAGGFRDRHLARGSKICRAERIRNRPHGKRIRA